MINDAIAKADSEHPVPANIMRRIDWAFEILKKQIAENETSQFQLDSRRMSQEDDGQNSETSKLSIFSDTMEHSALAIAVCQCQNSSWRTDNEDR